MGIKFLSSKIMEFIRSLIKPRYNYGSCVKEPNRHSSYESFMYESFEFVSFNNFEESIRFYKSSWKNVMLELNKDISEEECIEFGALQFAYDHKLLKF